MASTNDVILIGVLIFVFAIGFFTVFFISTQVTNQMLSIPAINSSASTVEVLQSQQKVTSKMDYVIFGLFIGLTLALIISGWFVGGHPIFMAIYFIVIIIATAMSAVLANVWETASTASIFGSTVASFPISNNLLTNLPIYTVIIGFLGMIVMFAKPFIMSETGGSTY
jgi:hypothetical protein